MRRASVALLLFGLICLLLPHFAVAAPAYPVKVGPTGRYLVDQNNVPFLIAGESPQGMIGVLSEADAELFFINRKAHGFNTVWINLLCNSYTGCRADGAIADPIAPISPFTAEVSPSIPDLTTPNPAYFDRADRILQLAAQYGFLVILDPIETGGWLGVLRGNGLAAARTYGRFLGQRYSSFDNIVWMHGNDFQTWQDSTDDAHVQAVARGIQDFDTRHLHTVQLNFNNSGSLDDPSWAPLIQLNATYTYAPTYQYVLIDYNRAPAVPTFMVEANYEFENNTGSTPSTPQVLRRQEYWSLLSGATGQLFGNKYTWQFIDGWKDNLDTPGAVQMAFLTALFSSRRWYDLVPDQSHELVIAGFGHFPEIDYVTAARTPDGQLAMAYVPTARTITVDTGQMGALFTARWYDPSAGTFVNIPGSPFTNSGSRNFATPGNNANGAEDWVLVLEVSTSGATNIAPNPVDLATAPNSFLISGGGFADQGAGLPVVNFVANGVLVGQARATGLANGVLTVPMPTSQTSLFGPLAGLAAGTIGVFVYNQAIGAGFTLAGSTNLTVNDTRCTTCATIAPNPMDLATAPSSFQITGGSFVDQGAGLPVVNFVANGVLVGQARATGLANGVLMVPMPTNQTSLSGPLAGLSAGTIGVFVYNQTVGAGFILAGGTNLTVTDTRCMTCATIAPNPVDLATAPSSFQITGGSFANQGTGLPVVNFVANGVLVGQSRATGLANGVLMVPMPTNQTSLSGPLAGLSAGTIGVFVYNYNPAVGAGFGPVGGTNLTVTDTRCMTCATIAPNPVDLAPAPSSFQITGGSFADQGTGLPVVNFVANGVLVGQARATGLANGVLTVPMPTNQTSLSGPLPGLGIGTVGVFVYNQTAGGAFNLAGSTNLTVSPLP